LQQLQGERREICRQIEKYSLNKGNPTTVRQVHHFSTSQPTLYLFNNIVPNRLSLIEGPQQKTKIL
jgi:hypothetical protein